MENTCATTISNDKFGNFMDCKPICISKIISINGRNASFNDDKFCYPSLLRNWNWSDTVFSFIQKAIPKL